MALIWKFIFITWELVGSSSLLAKSAVLYRQKYVETLYDVDISKVTVVSVSAHLPVLASFKPTAKSTHIDQILSSIQLTCFAA